LGLCIQVIEKIIYPLLCMQTQNACHPSWQAVWRTNIKDVLSKAVTG
jgi:hypothetical protein